MKICIRIDILPPKGENASAGWKCCAALRGELEHFRAAIEAGRMPETGVYRGAIANRIAWRAVDSWQTGSPVDMDFSQLQRLAGR